MLMQVVASQDWPEVTRYAGLVSAQTRRQELIQDLYKVWQDPQRGTVTGGMVRYDPFHLQYIIFLEWFYIYTSSVYYAENFSFLLGNQLDRNPRGSYSIGINLHLSISDWHHCPELHIFNISFCRDGVSEGQFYQVLLYELDAIRMVRLCFLHILTRYLQTKLLHEILIESEMAHWFNKPRPVHPWSPIISHLLPLWWFRSVIIHDSLLITTTTSAVLIEKVEIYCLVSYLLAGEFNCSV
jgi:hypothetical protein